MKYYTKRQEKGMIYIQEIPRSWFEDSQAYGTEEVLHGTIKFLNGILSFSGFSHELKNFGFDSWSAKLGFDHETPVEFRIEDPWKNEKEEFLIPKHAWKVFEKKSWFRKTKSVTYLELGKYVKKIGKPFSFQTSVFELRNLS